MKQCLKEKRICKITTVASAAINYGIRFFPSYVINAPYGNKSHDYIPGQIIPKSIL